MNHRQCAGSRINICHTSRVYIHSIYEENLILVELKKSYTRSPENKFIDINYYELGIRVGLYCGVIYMFETFLC